MNDAFRANLETAMWILGRYRARIQPADLRRQGKLVSATAPDLLSRCVWDEAEERHRRQNAPPSVQEVIAAVKEHVMVLRSDPTLVALENPIRPNGRKIRRRASTGPINLRGMVGHGQRASGAS